MNLWRMAGVVCLIGAEALIYGYSDPFLTQAFGKRELADWLIGLNASLAGAGIILFSPFLPRLIAEFDFRRLVASLVTISFLSFVTILLVDFIVVWSIACFIMGAGLASLWTTSEVWLNGIADSFGRKQSGYTASPAVPNLTYLEDSSFDDDEPIIPRELLAEAPAPAGSFPATEAEDFRPRKAATPPPSFLEPTGVDHRHEIDLTETFRQRAAKIAETSAQRK